MDLANSQLVAFPRTSLAALRAALIRDTGGGFSGFLQEAGYAGGESVFSAFRSWLGERGLPSAASLDVEEFQEQAAAFFQEIGWGRITITPLHDVVAMIDSEDWAEADPASGLQFPACHYTAGLFADFFGRTAAAPLAVLETECRSTGAHRCRFLVGSAEIMGQVYERMVEGASYGEAVESMA